MHSFYWTKYLGQNYVGKLTISWSVLGWGRAGTDSHISWHAVSLPQLNWYQFENTGTFLNWFGIPQMVESADDRRKDRRKKKKKFHAFFLKHSHLNGDQASETVVEVWIAWLNLHTTFGKSITKCIMYFLPSPKVNIAERTCCCLFCKCIGGDGTMGDPGPPGKRVILVQIYGLLWVVECPSDMGLSRNKGWFLTSK